MIDKEKLTNIKEAKENIIKFLTDNEISSHQEAESEAKLILEEICGVKMSDYLLNPDKSISENSKDEIEHILKERINRTPLQYILGKAWFYGNQFLVNNSTLIPRSDTEILVDEVLKNVKKDSNILDMCTGTGCIIISIAKELGENGGIFVGTDINSKAIETAENNATLNKVNTISFYKSDMFKGEIFTENPDAIFDIVVSNPPYIIDEVIETLEPEVKDNEPLTALSGGEDGLMFYRQIASGVGQYMRNGGKIFLEIGYDQGEAVKRILSEKGFEHVEVVKDFSGNDRVVKGIYRKKTDKIAE